MANKKEEALAVESKYTADELINGYTAFDVPKEVVMAVVRLNDVTAATEGEMGTMIKLFLKKEVK